LNEFDELVEEDISSPTILRQYKYESGRTRLSEHFILNYNNNQLKSANNKLPKQLNKLNK
jgi:hypothetical protein